MSAIPLPMMKNLGKNCQPSKNVVSVSQDILPSAAKNIGQLTNHEEDDGTEHNVCKWNPEDVGRRTDVLVDLGQDWRNQSVTYEKLSIQ